MSSPKPLNRPVTSKPRGICRYYNVSRGCFAGDKCKFLHAESAETKLGGQPSLTPYDKSKRCRYFANGFCKRGEGCWFLHVSDSKAEGNPVNLSGEEDELCSICFEKPVTFGLLGGCSHTFCITCIKQWRDTSGRLGDVSSGNTKKCPMCRTPSRYITPSSVFWKQEEEEKEKAVTAYKESMSRVPCRYFQQSKKKGKRSCPFGKDCFYKHTNDDGTPYTFQDGAAVCMRRYPLQSGLQMSDEDSGFFPFPLDLASIPFFATGGGMDIVINHTDLNAPLLRQRRVAERSRSGGGAPEMQQRTDREMRTSARRLRDVGMSLEVLNNALQEGANLERLQDAVATLRDGVLRPSDRTDIEDDEEREETEVMERLENLADQMLASLHVLRTEAQVAREGSETVPPALETLEGVRDAGTPLPALTWDFLQTARRRDRVDAEATSDDEMPTLQSVSNSSSSEDGEDSDDAVLLSEQGGIETFRPFDLAFDGVANRRTEEELGRPGQTWPSPEFIGQSSSGPTDLTETDDANEVEPLPLGSISDPDSAPSVEAGNSVAEPPFVTDGRGRVVWTSPSGAPVSTGKLDSTHGGFTPDETSSDTQVEGRGEDGPAAGNPRSLLGRMFDALF